MMLPPKNMIYKHGFLDIMPIDNLSHAQIVLIFNQEISVSDVVLKRKMYLLYDIGYRKEVCSYVKWNLMCHRKNFMLYSIKLSNINWLKSSTSFTTVHWNWFPSFQGIRKAKIKKTLKAKITKKTKIG